MPIRHDLSYAREAALPHRFHVVTAPGVGMSSSLELHTFGGLRIAISGELVKGFRSRTAEALLVYLAIHSRPFSREWLAELLWPERPAETSQANLRVALHRLGQKLSPCLSVTRQTVGVKAEGQLYLDATEFERRLGLGQLTEALNLYGGDFLEGFHLDGSPAFENWAASERERLHDLAVVAFQELIGRHVAQNRVDEAMALARRLLDLEPLHEPTRRVLIRLLAQKGRRKAALEHFEAYRQLLKEGLGLEPERVTLALFETIRQGDLGDEEIAEIATSTTALRVPRSNIPYTTTPLLGRWVELEGILSRLENPDCRLITVTGPGGAGKTRLAAQAALDGAPGFPDGVCFVPLAGVTSPEAIVPTILQCLDLTLPPSGEAKTQLLSNLRLKKMLLVFDNFEQLLEGSLLLLEILHHALNLKLLVTSRERLALSEEWLMPLSGLKVDEAAVALFVQSAERVAPVVDLSREEAAIREICRLVEGFPLAIELAASWVGVMTCEGIAQEIRTSLDFLNSRLRDVPERHRSVRGLFNTSWNLLTPEEQAVFMRLSVFRGGFAAREARHVAGASLEELRALMDKSLMRGDGHGRFELHELIRQYAGEKLAASGQAQYTARQHFEAYLALAEEAEPQLFGTEQPKWLKRLEAEWDNFRAALTWGFISGQDVGDLVRMLVALAWFWIRGATSEAREWLERALALPELTPYHRAALFYHSGRVAWMQSAWAVAEAQLQQALELWAELGLKDGQEAARTRCSLAMTRYMQGDSGGARSLFEVALEVFRREGDAWWTASALGWLGKAAVALEDYDAARETLDECLAIYRRLGNHWGLGLFLGPSAQLRFDTGDLRGARKLAEESQVLLTEVNHTHALAEAYRLLGAIAGAEGHYDEAEEHYQRSLALYHEIGLENFFQEVAQELAGLHQTIGRGV